MHKKALFLLSLVALILFFLPLHTTHAATYPYDAPVISSVENTAEGIQVAWDEVEGAEAYTILRKTGTGGWFKMATTQETIWIDESPTSGKIYYYSVRCSKADGSQYTSTRDQNGTPMICIRSRNITIEEDILGLKLKWSAIANVSGYDVLRRRAGETEWETVLNTAQTTVIDMTAESNIEYEYTVRGKVAVNGEVFYGAIDESKVKSKSFIKAPVITSAKNDGDAIAITWDAVPGADTYTVLRKTGENGKWVKKIVKTDTEYRDTDVVSGKTYYYSVRCSNATATKYTSLRDPNGTPVFCMKSRNITLSNKLDGVHISWSAISGADDYQVFRVTENDSGLEYTTIGITSSTSFTDMQVENNRSYSYTVRGRKQADWSDTGYALGGISSEKVQSIKYLTAPAITEITQDGTSIQVKWDAVEGAENYTILKKTNSGSWKKKASTTETSWTDAEGKTSGNIYTYAVRCSTPDGASYTSARDDGTSYAYLKNPTIKAGENRVEGVKLTIGLVKCTQAFEVHRIDMYGEDVLLGTMENNNQNTVSFTDLTAVENSSYNYYVIGIYDDTRVMSNMFGIWFARETQTLYVKDSFVNLYATPDATSESITIPYRTEVKYIGVESSSQAGTWKQIQYQDAAYYMWEDIGQEKLSETRSEGNYSSENPYVQQVLDEALNIIHNQNTTYRRNDSTGIPDENGKYGYDCSGFVSYCIKKVMRQAIPTFDYYAKVDSMYALTTLYNEGLPGEYQIADVALEDIQPGDVIFFNLAEESGDETENEFMPNHVGIYLGNQEFIHCTHYNWGGDGVYIMPMDEYYTSSITGIKRFIPASVQSAETTMYFAGFRINLRDADSIDSNIVATAYGNEAATVLFTSENWAYISYNGENYFIGLTYLSSNPFLGEAEPKILGIIKGTLYSAPTSESEEKVTIYAGEEVDFKGQFFDSLFYVISYQGIDWYFYTEQDINDILLDSIEDLEKEGVAYSVTTSTNMRTQPETNAPVIRMLRRGEQVQVLLMPNPNSNWCMVKTANDEIGFTSFSALSQ